MGQIDAAQSSLFTSQVCDIEIDFKQIMNVSFNYIQKNATYYKRMSAQVNFYLNFIAVVWHLHISRRTSVVCMNRKHFFLSLLENV